MANPRLANFTVGKLNGISGKREVGARCIVPLQKTIYFIIHFLSLIGQFVN